MFCIPSFHIIFYFGELHSFNFFLWWADQIGSQHQKKKVELVRHPQLINMKQNKYPQINYVLKILPMTLTQAKNDDQQF
jgi:hypothetical protein